MEQVLTTKSSNTRDLGVAGVDGIQDSSPRLVDCCREEALRSNTNVFHRFTCSVIRISYCVNKMCFEFEGDVFGSVAPHYHASVSVVRTLENTGNSALETSLCSD